MQRLGFLVIVVLYLFIAGCAAESENAEAPADEPAPATAAEATPEPAATGCRLSDAPEVWGPAGNGGWARQWLLGECAVIGDDVITYVDLAASCADQQTEADCLASNTLGACGANVSLVDAMCTECLPACVDTSATCQPDGVCSNSDQPCDNNEQCSFSRPVEAQCPEGSSMVTDWAQYYQLVGGTGDAPMTYCTWT